jgi:hypothetical protein
LLIAFHDLGCSNISAALLRVIVSADVDELAYIVGKSARKSAQGQNAQQVPR